MAGVAWLLVIVAGIMAEFFIRMPLIAPGDPATTAANIAGSASLFRLSMVGDLIMLSLDIVATLGLYILLAPVNRGLALLAAFFRLVMGAILGINLVNLVLALSLSTGSAYLSIFETDQLQALAMQFVEAHSSGYDISLVFFGLHLLVLGYLIYRSGYLPRILGVLLTIASLGYLIDSFANVLLPKDNAILATTAGVLIAVAVLAELSLSLWLLFRSSRMPQEGS